MIRTGSFLIKFASQFNIINQFKVGNQAGSFCLSSSSFHKQACECKVSESQLCVTGYCSRIGCPRNNEIFFGWNRNKPKLNLFRLFFGLFRETKKHFFRFVSVCFGVSDWYRNNRNKQNFLKTNRHKQKKISKKRSLLGGPRNR